ncbi:heme ABC exporter ATP-binding protein CcmA [Paenibacillus sp. PDC88]|uniref:heme ABC exporter ATP-binding protein CcmA n=1 Tax=Paenibacillus sp. PDC88 TaxID=1884375 RepID=UPI000897BD73|nr:heme ABC exporter ATP-binding protein CcmA [Paenibacillus sp. PDC88]SDW74082.1 heme ABC exporter, ATP-binding protein CcmA [Paenibacillus sp. PDC88]
MDELVIVKQLNKLIKKKCIVEELSFTLAAGEVLALCGGNGAGKSTVLRMLTGISEPTSGEISVNKRSRSTDRMKYAEQLGYMPDDYSFQQGLTANESLKFWASIRRLPQTRVQEVLAIVGLEDQKEQKVSTFSKGMSQRLLFAQAILSKPRLLIMDEPTNGLDPYWMKELVSILVEMKQHGQTVIFSTHQLDIAEEAADKVIFLNNGKNVGEGTVSMFKQKHGSLSAAFHHSLGLK